MQLRLVVLAAVLSLIAACGQGSVSTSSQSSAASPSPSTDNTTATTTTTTSASSSDSAPIALLVADDTGIRLLEGGMVVSTFLEGRQATLAVPDLTGGVVYQESSHRPTDLRWDEDLARNVFEWSDGGPDPIWRIAAPDEAPEPIITHPDAQLTLVDVIRFDGRPTVLFRQYVGGPQREPVFDIVFDWLCLHDIESGETRLLGLLGSYESSWNEMRIGGELVATTHDPYGESAGTMVGFTTTAALDESVEYDWLPTLIMDRLDYGPRADCAVVGCQTWARATAASDGSRLSWVQGGFRLDDGTATPLLIEIVTVDPVSASVTMRASVGWNSPVEPGWRAGFIDDDGSFIVVSGAGPEGQVVLMDSAGTVTEIPHRGATVGLWEVDP